MTPQQMTDLVEAYFDAVDRKHLADTLALFVPDAQFHIPTHGLHFKGRDGEISGMYQRLFDRYAQVWHGDFVHVVQAPQRIASQFRVENTGHQGERWTKHNCNFFRLRGALFEDVSVYMAGENSLT